MRRAARVDANQRAIRQAFEGMGWSVHDTSGAGCGFPDLVIGKSGVNVLIEVKDGDKPRSQQKLTGQQLEFHKIWRGPLEIVRSVDDAIAVNTRWDFIRYNSDKSTA